MPEKKQESKKVEQNTAIAVLVLNMVIPGIGTLIAGDLYQERIKNEGVIQVILFGGGCLLTVIFIGVFPVIAAWVWALTSSIAVLKNAGMIK